MVKGGYQIINFNGVKLTKNTIDRISNIFDKIDGTNKAILLSGLNVDGVDYRDVVCTPILIRGRYVIKVFGFRIYISANDSVTVEDEILFLGENIDIGQNPEGTLSADVYRGLDECFYGDLRTIKCLYDGTDVYFNIVTAVSTINSLYFAFSGGLKSISMMSDNKISIKGV